VFLNFAARFFVFFVFDIANVDINIVLIN
jgi:hypothetical protein